MDPDARQQERDSIDVEEDRDAEPPIEKRQLHERGDVGAESGGDGPNSASDGGCAIAPMGPDRADEPERHPEEVACAEHARERA